MTLNSLTRLSPLKGAADAKSLKMASWGGYGRSIHVFHAFWGLGEKVKRDFCHADVYDVLFCVFHLNCFSRQLSNQWIRPNVVKTELEQGAYKFNLII